MMNITMTNGLSVVVQSHGHQGNLTSLPWTYFYGTSKRMYLYTK